MTKKILIIGGSGFIGRNLSEYLSSLNVENIVFDRILPNFKCNYIIGDINDYEQLESSINSCDSVINLAGILGTTETINTPEYCYKNNISGALNLYEILKKQPKNCIQISVGNYWMNNPYSITKNTAEKIALFYNKKFSTNIKVVRALNAYGPYQSAYPVRKLIPNLIIPALKGKEILIYGSGNQKMDMIYVGDLVKILFFLLQKKNIKNDIIYEAGSGLAPSVNDICDKVIDLTKTKSKIKHIEMRKGETPESVVLGNTKYIEDVGYDINSLLSLDNGLTKTITYYKKT